MRFSSTTLIAGLVAASVDARGVNIENLDKRATPTVYLAGDSTTAKTGGLLMGKLDTLISLFLLLPNNVTSTLTTPTQQDGVNTFPLSSPASPSSTRPFPAALPAPTPMKAASPSSPIS